MIDREWSDRSRLDLLLKTFEISGKDFARIIHVDEALISKWRHNKRILRASSASADKIVDFFLSIDRPTNFSTLRKILLANYKEAFDVPEAELTVYMKNWLTDAKHGDEESDLFDSLKSDPDVGITISYHLSKNNGRRMAIKFFNEYAKKHQDATEIIAFTTEDGAWFYEDKAFREDRKESYFELLNAGKIIKVIHPVNRSYEDMADSIISWLPIHLTGKTIDYYIPSYSTEPVNYTYCLIPGLIALTGASSNNYTKYLDSWLTNDEYVLKNTAKIIQEYINRSYPLFNRFYIESGKLYLNELIDIVQRRNTRYYHCSAPLYLPMSESLLEEIFRRNDQNEKDIRSNIENYIRLAALNVSVLNRYAIDIKSLKKNLLKDEVELHTLTYLTGTRIMVDQELYRRTVRERFDAMRTLSTIEVGIISADKHDDFEDITVLGQENTGVQFLGSQAQRPFVMMLHEITFTVAVMERIKAIWKEIPALMKDKAYVYEQIAQLINTAQ